MDGDEVMQNHLCPVTPTSRENNKINVFQVNCPYVTVKFKKQICLTRLNLIASVTCYFTHGEMKKSCCSFFVCFVLCLLVLRVRLYKKNHKPSEQ